MKRVSCIILSIIGIFALVAPHHGRHSSGAQTVPSAREEAIQRLQNSLVGRGRVNRNRATRLVDFVRLEGSTPGTLSTANGGVTRKERSFDFLTRHHQSFGLINPAEELKLISEQRDRQDGAHLTFNQVYRGVPVFAGVLKTHFNSAGELRAVNGVIVPDIHLTPIPSRSSDEAAAVALAKVQTDSPDASALSIRGTRLYVYRTGLAQGVDGENHLAWEVEISNDRETCEFVYIDAQAGKFLDQITGSHDALDRRVYDGQNIPALLPPNFPSNPFWVEGQAFPTGVANADEIIASSKEIYDLFNNAIGRDSVDDLGSTMWSIFDIGFVGAATTIPQLNLAAFSNDLISDDVVAHEWTHVYTYYTNNLVSQSQPGALNEAYSDIFGETVDLLNGRGPDTGGQREVDDCERPVPTLYVNSPASLSGDRAMAPAAFGPPFGSSGVSGDIVLVNDGSGVRTDACQTPFRNARELNGRIALIDWTNGTCSKSDQVKNAQLNGAIAVIVASDPSIADTPIATLGIDPTINIPSGIVGFSDGQALRSPRLGTVNVTITGSGGGSSSQRWQIGEQTAFRGFRDMWNPRCFGNPGKVSDREYFCGTFDFGGIHLNSGIPNHAYALLVDGGIYNNRTIASIGFTKAAHIYLRAMMLYHTPVSDFADHAEALEASASDLEGVNLPDLLTGLPSGQVISQFDRDQVHQATLAVELRQPPAQCGFEPLLAKDPPADSCPAIPNVQATIFSDDFENDPTSNWTISRDVSSSETFTSRDWVWVHQLPNGRAGSGFFALDPVNHDCIFLPLPGEAGVLHLDSPEITVPRLMVGGPHMSFDHYVAAEAGFDGGQLLISVNGGPFQLVDSRSFIHNPYNMKLFPASLGSNNPRSDQLAFSGTDGGSLRGSWGTSIVDLTHYANSGDRIRLRWDFSTDICFGTNLGWYIDNVRVYACQPQFPSVGN